MPNTKTNPSKNLSRLTPTSLDAHHKKTVSPHFAPKVCIAVPFTSRWGYDGMVINKFMQGGLGMVIAVIQEIWDGERCDAVVIC